MSNVYENLSSGNFNSHIDSDGQNGGSVIDNKPSIGSGAKKVLLNVGLTAMTSAALAGVYGCSPTEAVASTPEPAAVTSVVDNSGETIVHTSNETTPEITPSPIPEVTEAPTPTLAESFFSEERRAELNQQFQDFLNKQGEFTPEKMSSKMMATTSLLDNDKVGLGIADYQPLIQGYFFDYFEKDNRIFLLMGFDGKDGNRFITPLEIPLYFYEGIEEAEFLVSKNKENYIQGPISEEGFVDYGERAKLIPLLNMVKGKVIGFTLSMYTYSKEGAKDDEYGRIAGGYVDEINPKVDLSFGLIQLIPSNEIDYDGKDKNGDSNSILKINNSDDINDINVNDVPIVMGISYFAEEEK